MQRPEAASDRRFADVATAFAEAAWPHQVEYRFARGNAMGKAGRQAYAAGQRALEKRKQALLTESGESAPSPIGAEPL